jgi:hypothetical protein
MKKLLSLLTIVLLLSMAAYSQAPGIFNYQGVARNSVGNVLVNKLISLRLTIHDVTAAGPVVYQESRTVITNPFGLFNIQVGSPGGSNVTGTIAGVPWGVGAKFIQVEIDPNGGVAFFNIGTAQIASVPYAWYATVAGDLVLPFIRTQAAAGTTLIGLTNSAATGTQGAFTGTSASTDNNAFAITGTISSASPGGFSAGLRGINNGTGGLGIGVSGSQNGSGWGVYGVTPSGIGVFGTSTSGTGVLGSSTSGVGVQGTSSTSNAGRFEITNSANNTDALVAATNGAGASWAFRGTATGLQGAGIFTYNNAAGAANAVRITNNGSGAGISVSQTGTGSAGVFATTGTGTVPTVNATNSSLAGNAFTIVGEISATNPGGFSAGIRGVNNGTGGLGIGVWGSHAGSGWGVYGTANGGIGVNGSASSGIGVNGTSNTGTGGRFTTTSGLALHTTGGVRLQGISEANNFVLTSDATGNGTWVDPALLLPGANFWTRVGTNLWNTNQGDNVGIGTTAPTHRLTVSHGGSTGISVTSTAGFSVIDINAQNGDAALRFGNNGTNQWNLRNRPGDNYLEFFELGGGGSRVVIQDGTGNVGIGETANPTYKLDVLHGGATGIRSRSSGTFSVIDIDAANGDAALRFQAAGTGQWNTRNRPADNFYEIFELGGGGSRVVIQDGTGNVGIGESNAPTHKLHVLHGGATGILSQSAAGSGSFSVIDIDADNGDAALRFQRQGTGQWNTRNRPADDYYEIFELGGGGSRVVIQDGSGNVGIGETTNPTYKLDVLHGGATGIRSRSSGTFSLMDIDAANGDAALRFAKAGVNQWNTRNRPADDYYEIFELGGGGSRFVIQDGSGNVGIGETTNPTYKLDVLHGGATGIRSRSSGTFSLMDIDAANGDAALRFASAGVNQWNTRNRPADNYYEIFELGGGGSRVVIQDGSGNVGIGETVNPTYKLDVLHGGATGIRSRSSGTFSLMDIDAANGDAALRFAKAGVNQWNTRNNPATDDYQIFELGGGGERLRIENTTGNIVIPGNLAKGGGSFRIDHPLDPTNKYLYHSFVESPDMMNIYNGNIVTDAAGKATVELPAYFEALNMEFRYQLTVIGSFSQAIVSKEVAANKFEIATSTPNVKVSWQVTGVRHDAYANMNRIPTEVEKSAKDKGTYIHPKAFNQPVSKGENYTSEGPSSLDQAPILAPKTAPVTTGPSSLDQAPIVPPVVNSKVTEKGTSLEQGPVVAPVTTKTAEKGGSVENVTAPKTNKPAPATKGGSLDEMPKPVENKKASTDPGSTKTE